MEKQNNLRKSIANWVIAIAVVVGMLPTAIINIIQRSFYGGTLHFLGGYHSWVSLTFIIAINGVSIWLCLYIAKKKNFTGKVFEWEIKRQKKRYDESVKIYEHQTKKLSTDIKKVVGLYFIVSVRRVGLYDFELLFNGELYTFEDKSIRETLPSSLPEVRIGTKLLNLHNIKKNTATIRIDTAIPNEESFDLYCEGKAFNVRNPYWFVFVENSKTICCQLEGSISERNVYIACECFPNLDKELKYHFNLYRNNNLIGEYQGRYSANDGCIKISLGKVLDKTDYQTGRCCLRYFFGMNVRVISLPAPIVVSVNNKLIREAIF